MLGLPNVLWKTLRRRSEAFGAVDGAVYLDSKDAVRHPVLLEFRSAL
jgi:hypothetical protein